MKVPYIRCSDNSSDVEDLFDHEIVYRKVVAGDENYEDWHVATADKDLCEGFGLLLVLPIVKKSRLIPCFAQILLLLAAEVKLMP